MLQGWDVCAVGLAEHGLLSLCLDLFVQFPFNNLLHHLVTEAVCFILEHGSPEMLGHLLQPCQLVPWLVGAPEEVEPATTRGTGELSELESDTGTSIRKTLAVFWPGMDVRACQLKLSALLLKSLRLHANMYVEKQT